MFTLILVFILDFIFGFILGYLITKLILEKEDHFLIATKKHTLSSPEFFKLLKINKKD